MGVMLNSCLLAALATGLVAPAEAGPWDPGSSTAHPVALVGAWMGAASRASGVRRGLVLEADGGFALIGFPGLFGQRWQVKDDELLLYTSTTHQPESELRALQITRMTPQTLSLEARADALTGIYHRDDAAVGQVQGVLRGPEGSTLPVDALVLVSLVDLSHPGTPGTLVAGELMPTEGRQVPISFRLYYDRAAMEAGHSYAIEASIAIEGALAYRTERTTPVVTGDSPAAVKVVLQPVPQD
jgi:uncharacterized lipoprotein YbaY